MSQVLHERTRRRRDRSRSGSVALTLVAVALALMLLFDWPHGLQLRRGASAPTSRDYIAIDVVPARPPSPAVGPDASTGTFSSSCGRNDDAHHNSDNLITFPGQPGAAQHTHEYVGNQSTDAYSTDEELASSATTCGDGDRSAYFWTVLRDVTPADERVNIRHEWYGGEHNRGRRLPATSVQIQYRGNRSGPVVPMPPFLRLVSGNARALTLPASGSSRAQWSCAGSPELQTQLYPLCGDGREVVRTYDFPSCWDGRQTDSHNHRAHASYPLPDGRCPHNTFPVPQLRLVVTYNVPAGRSYAIDSFPEQRRSPATDHAEFVNVMPEPLMAEAVDCINSGRVC